MNIRLMGTPDECTAALAAIRAAGHLDILEVSRPVPNRGDSQLVRVYVQARVGRQAAGG